MEVALNRLKFEDFDYSILTFLRIFGNLINNVPLFILEMNF
jgi:hypothetical protein